jgi:wyosine [tRNA(Phe)-imidazoG37] synthetase (radical SAM superfamily)
MAEMRGPALRYPSVEEVGRELEETLTHLCQKGISPDALTLAGNGEPTLHPDFPGLVDAILRVRKVLAPRARVVLLTNATLLGNPRIQAACLRLDEVMAKLDAGRAETMRRIDLPLVAWSPERLVEVARNFPRDQARLTIQTIFLEGTIPNTSEEEIRAWIEHLGRIRPDAVEIYTLDRAPATPGLRPVSQAWLTALAERVRAETGLVVHVS